MIKTISHLYQTPEGDWVIQSNEEHTEGVAKLASLFTSGFGMASWGEALGNLHDKGKESDAFQRYIRKESGYEPNTKVVGNHHHAYVGALIARRLYGKTFDNLLVNQILSHHSGLHDSDEIDSAISKELKLNLNNELPQEIDTNVRKIDLNKSPFTTKREDFHHLARMLYSCLVDADYLDTESFMDKKSYGLRQDKAELKDLLPLLESRLAHFKSSTEKSKINVIRNQVQEQCVKMADTPIGFYSLTVPTGGGKTLSSLLWAMKHAIRNGQKRVIIAIPYTSIIMQTAAVLRGIFGDENVLEHHSNVDPENIKDESLRDKMKLATENWDYPIIVTTNVQLFESMFSDKPSVCRKLHNIANSVVILDEVQTLPTDYLQPVVDSLKTYNKLFKVSFLFTTASQPVLSGLIEGCNPRASFTGIEHVNEIIPEDFKLHDRLRRVQLSINNEGKSYDEIAEMLLKHEKVLCIVNTRADAREIYRRLPQEGITLHLSKNMCPAHISENISLLKASLKDEQQDVIRVVSTQLIEAGVDIDFPVVYRQEAGLDSILQAAGRCNREGKNGMSTTYVFSLAKEHALPRGDMQAANNARLSLKDTSDWFAPITMTEYFRQLYCRKESFDSKDIKHYLYSPTELYFAKGAKAFQLIEDSSISVIVCWKDSMDLVNQVLRDGPSYMLMKKLAQYTVNVKQTDFKKLSDMGVVSEKKEGFYVVEYQQQYDPNLGLLTDNNWTTKPIVI